MKFIVRVEYSLDISIHLVKMPNFRAQIGKRTSTSKMVRMLKMVRREIWTFLKSSGITFTTGYETAIKLTRTRL